MSWTEKTVIVTQMLNKPVILPHIFRQWDSEFEWHARLWNNLYFCNNKDLSEHVDSFLHNLGRRSLKHAIEYILKNIDFFNLRFLQKKYNGH